MTTVQRDIKELVVVSGKGGTGKTSLAASLAVLAGRAVVADCDVDAADLHLILAPHMLERESEATVHNGAVPSVISSGAKRSRDIRHRRQSLSQSRPDPSTALGATEANGLQQDGTACERHEFRCGHEAVIRSADCIRCGACLAHCRFGAVKIDGAGAGDAVFSIDPVSCEGCGVCVRFCPVGAIDFPERLCGEWMVSQTRCGPMVHARLSPAAENSGKLVSTVRREARRIAEQNGHSLLIVDGPPGIGCPVIASITGADFVLIVTEPTLAGQHDLERVLRLAAHFEIPVAVCINKFDINPGISESIARIAAEGGAPVLGNIPYDTDVTKAQIAGLSVVEHSNGPAKQRIESLWRAVIGRVRGTETSD